MPLYINVRASNMLLHASNAAPNKDWSFSTVTLVIHVVSKMVQILAMFGSI